MSQLTGLEVCQHAEEILTWPQFCCLLVSPGSSICALLLSLGLWKHHLWYVCIQSDEGCRFCAIGCTCMTTEYSRILMCMNLDVEDFDHPCSPSLMCLFPPLRRVLVISLGCPVGFLHPPAMAMIPQLSPALSFRK